MSNNKLIQIAIDTVFFTHSYSGITKVWEIILHNLYNLSNFISPDENSIYNIPRYEIILLIRGNTIPDSLKKIIRNNNSYDNSNDNRNDIGNGNVKITHLIILQCVMMLIILIIFANIINLIILCQHIILIVL